MLGFGVSVGPTNGRESSYINPTVLPSCDSLEEGDPPARYRVSGLRLHLTGERERRRVSNRVSIPPTHFVVSIEPAEAIGDAANLLCVHLQFKGTIHESLVV